MTSTNKRPSSRDSDVVVSKRQAVILPLSPKRYPAHRYDELSSSDGVQSGFANLPHEVLVMICRHALVQDQTLKLHPRVRQARETVTQCDRHPKARHPLLAILLASRAMYFAGSEVYYGSNILRFHHPEHLRGCVPFLSIDARLSVRHIQLTVMWIMTRRVPRSWRPWCDTACYTSLGDSAKAFTNLKCLELVSVGQSGSDKSAWSDAERENFESSIKAKLGNVELLLFTWRTTG